jgi:5-methyltetrahydropteroyltriglutamate--homocysteine methyltransferase
MAATSRLLPTMGVGSAAAPGWFIKTLRDSRRTTSGEIGAHDLDEAIDDALRVTVSDQLDCDFDVISDVELRRQRFVYEMYDWIEGIERIPPRRKLGIAGYDMAPRFAANETPHAPRGFGLVADYQRLRELVVERECKVAIPGPLTFLNSIEPGGLGVDVLADAVVAMIRAEIAALGEAGLTFVQIDEPSLAHPPHGLSHEQAVELINRVLHGFEGRRAVHVCFGNNAGRPFANRRFDRLSESLLQFECDLLVLEFANREMSEASCLSSLSAQFEIAAGVIDVKNFHVESIDEIIDRIQTCLEFVALDRLWLTADCGFSALPRYVAVEKMRRLGEAARQMRACY